MAFRLLLVIGIMVFFGSCSQFMPLRDDTAGVSLPTKRPYSTPPSRLVGNVIRNARAYTGTPYQYGGTTSKGMDCSGLVQVAFQKAGIDLPRATIAQAATGKPVSLNGIRPGDLVFFYTDKKNPGRISHVGIVTLCQGMRDIRFIHASSTGVREDNLYADYYQKTFAKAIRPSLTP